MKYVVPFLLLMFLASESGASVKTEVVEYKQGNTVLEGYLAYDDAIRGVRPGVLIIHEWWGQSPYERKRAEQLAQLGYVAFALDMYGKGKRTGDPSEAGKMSGEFKNNRALARERFDAGLDVLRKNPFTDKKRIAAIGYCFGGTVVLEMARAGEDLAGVVSFHGLLAPSEPAKPGAVKARILALAGGDDPFVPASQVAAFEDEMRKAGADWQVDVYGGAEHSFTNPDSGGYGLKGAKYNEAADKRSWEAMKLFFSEIFR